MSQASSPYISAGGNRHPSAADWDAKSGLLAFGANQNVALWDPLVSKSPDQQGIKRLLYGHTDTVNAVAFHAEPKCNHTILISGSVDKTLRVWKLRETELCDVQVISQHQSSINCIACFPSLSLVASGSADATIKIWQLQDPHRAVSVTLSQDIEIRPKFFPLAIVIHDVGRSGDVLMAAAGTRSMVEIYLRSVDGHFSHVASLDGHEGWIRSLAITRESTSSSCDLILASASQDKYIRLWRIATRQRVSATGENGRADVFDTSLSNKRHIVSGSEESHLLTFEALLLGHEDWVYSLSWRLQDHKPSLQLLSASADNSVAIWTPEIESDIWVCSARLGEISLQKGSTTATGSTGGFWDSLWSPTGRQIVSLVGTGSWRMWERADNDASWVQKTAISGHTKAVTGLSWTSNGQYLLSTSSDQTTRLHAEWRRSDICTWHEFGRPQIHGYDLNCIGTIKQSQFISGADEKLLRVFDEPRETANVLHTLCGIESVTNEALPETASIPVLGLSNKTADVHQSSTTETSKDRDHINDASIEEIPASGADSSPPTEDLLARLTLWPEREKLYGHGHEIAALAVSQDGSLVATSCKASALEHAVIRLYSTKDWREIKPALSAHNLTVTALAFSPDDQFILSVGRDRQWALFERKSRHVDEYILQHSNPKGHSRMILDACWAPASAGRVFATAGRDKAMKFWRVGESQVHCEITITLGDPVTALSVAPVFKNGSIVVAGGTEQGDVRVIQVSLEEGLIKRDQVVRTGNDSRAAINDLAWRPRVDARDEKRQQLAIASQDGSIEIVEDVLEGSPA